MADSVGLLLLASNGTLLLRSSTALQLTNIPTPIPPIIHLPPASPLGPASASAASESESESDPGEHTHPQHSLCCCNLIKHQLWLACITRADIEPAIVFEYLNRFYSLLSTYLTTNNQLNPTQIEANFGLVHQLIHLTAPTNENPYGKNWADPALIHEIIPTKSNSLVKFISEATETLSKGKSHHQPKPTIFSSTIPWRPTGLEYPKQEIWLDLIESISAIVDPDGHILSFELVGIVDIQSRLSGLPDISLKFSDPTKIDRVGFHSCVRYSRWEKEKLVSFVPPDGRFRLMSYRSTPSSASLPVTIRPTVTLGEQGGSFILLISCHASVARLVIRWQLGRLATGVVSDQLLCRARDGRRIEPVWEWEEARKQIRCTFEGIDTNCCLSGLWTHRSKENEPSHAIQVDFESKSESPNLSFQGLKVDKLDIKPHPSFPDHHHQPFSHHHQQTRAGLAALAAPFGTRTAVSKGVKMKFRSAQYEVRW